MTMCCEIPGASDEPLDQHSDTLNDIRHRAYREQSREDTVGIVVCDKDRLFVEGIAALIEQWDEFDLLAKIYSYDDAIEAAKEHLPAVVLLGARVGDTPCAPVIRDILAFDPGVCIMVLASSGDSREVLDALRAGAMGYGVRNELSVDRLRGTIWGMVCGEVVFDGAPFAPICRKPCWLLTARRRHLPRRAGAVEAAYPAGEGNPLSADGRSVESRGSRAPVYQ